MLLAMKSRASASLLEFPCRSSQKIGLLAGPCEAPLTCKGMAKAIWDGDNRKIEGAYQTGCRSTEAHPARTTTGATKRPPKHPTTHPNLMFHYRVFGCLGAVFPAGGCCNLSQTVSDARRQSKLLQTVHKLLPSVANRENLPIQCPDAFAPFPC